MEFAGEVFYGISWFCFFCLVLGFFKPQWLLWWEYSQNRLKILKIYGSGFILSFILSLIM